MYWTYAQHHDSRAAARLTSKTAQAQTLKLHAEYQDGAAAGRGRVELHGGGNNPVYHALFNWNDGSPDLDRRFPVRGNDLSIPEQLCNHLLSLHYRVSLEAIRTRAGTI